MNKERQLAEVRALEERLKSASPADAGRIAKRLVKLKDAWMNE